MSAGTEGKVAAHKTRDTSAAWLDFESLPKLMAWTWNDNIGISSPMQRAAFLPPYEEVQPACGPSCVSEEEVQHPSNVKSGSWQLGIRLG